MFRLARMVLLPGVAAVIVLWVAGCGGGSGPVAGGMPSSATSRGSVRVGLPPIPSSRATTTYRADISLFGEGMANAKKASIPFGSSGTMVSFTDVPQGPKCVIALVWDESAGGRSAARGVSQDAPVTAGITQVDVRPGQNNPATLTWSSPPDINTTSIARSYSLPGVSTPVSVLVTSPNPDPSTPEAYLLGATPEGIMLYGWIQPFDVSGVRSQRQTSLVSVPIILSQPVAVLPAGKTIGYERETSTGFWLDIDDATMKLLAAVNPSLPVPAHGDIVGRATVYVHYVGVNGVTVPLGDVPNATLLDIRISARNNPDVPARIRTDFGVTNYHAEAVGPVLSWVHRPDPDGGVQDTLRVLLDTSAGRGTSLARAANVPYPLHNSLYPLEVGRSWLWWNIEMTARP